MSVKLFKHKIQAYEMPAETDKARILRQTWRAGKLSAERIKTPNAVGMDRRSQRNGVYK